MTAARVLLLVAFVVVGASADRSLLQDSSCPAPKNPDSDCVSTAATFQSSCRDFINTLNDKRGDAKLENNNQAIQDFVKSVGSTPSEGCCTASENLLKKACVCSTAVQNLAKSQQNLSPSDLVVVGKTFSYSCNKPICNDACRLPASAVAG